MLSEEKNRLLTRVGAGTPIGELLRRRLFDRLDAVAAGRDPKGLMRDPERNRQVPLPSDSRSFFLDGLPLEQYQRHQKWHKLLTHFLFHAGQPAEVQRAYEAATGVSLQNLDVVVV